MSNPNRPIKKVTPSMALKAGMSPVEYQRHWEAQGYKVHFVSGGVNHSSKSMKED